MKHNEDTDLLGHVAALFTLLSRAERRDVASTDVGEALIDRAERRAMRLGEDQETDVETRRLECVTAHECLSIIDKSGLSEHNRLMAAMWLALSLFNLDEDTREIQVLNFVDDVVERALADGQNWYVQCRESVLKP